MSEKKIVCCIYCMNFSYEMYRRNKLLIYVSKNCISVGFTTSGREGGNAIYLCKKYAYPFICDSYCIFMMHVTVIHTAWRNFYLTDRISGKQYLTGRQPIVNRLFIKTNFDLNQPGTKIFCLI